MLEYLTNLKTVLDTIEKIKKAFESLRYSNLFIQETDIYDLVEKHFALDPLPKGKIQLTGRLSNYTLNNSFPIYTPAHLQAIDEYDINEYSIEEKKQVKKTRLQLKVKALNVPSISYNPIYLADNSLAKILWLYPEYSEGLSF